MNTENYVLDFLMSSGLSENPSSILIKPVIGETNAPPGHERSFQPDAVVVRKSGTTLFVFVIHSSEPADMETLAENLRSVERILFGPYKINVPDHSASRIILLFESHVTQAAFEEFLLQKGYAFEFPLLLTNNKDQKITQYPKEKLFLHRLKDRLLNLGKRSIDY